MPLDADLPLTVEAGSEIDRLAALLITSGAIDQRTLDRARRVAADTGGRLDRILTQLGMVSERALAEAFAQLLSVPLVTAAEYPEEPLLPERLKAKFLRRARAMPVAIRDEGLVLAMADPLDDFT